MRIFERKRRRKEGANRGGGGGYHIPRKVYRGREIFILFFLFPLFIFISLRSPDLGGIVYIPGGGVDFFFARIGA